MKGAKDIYLEDNCGGNFILIRDYGDGTYKFEVGARCVMVLRKTGTITEITDWLVDVTVDPENTVLLNGF